LLHAHILIYSNISICVVILTDKHTGDNRASPIFAYNYRNSVNAQAAANATLT
jgi:hypothetical protein